MGFLRGIFGRSEPEHHHSDEPVPGWDAINAALAPIYGDVEPLHWGTIIRWRMGGPDPLDGTSAYRADGPPPHWHFVSYGLSELYRKESDDPERSGWGIELTFRVRRAPDDDQPPQWALGLLQNLARYVFETGNVLGVGDHMDLFGPIALEESTEIRAAAFVLDPQLGRIDTPHGAVAFLQVVGPDHGRIRRGAGMGYGSAARADPRARPVDGDRPRPSLVSPSSLDRGRREGTDCRRRVVDGRSEHRSIGLGGRRRAADRHDRRTRRRTTRADGGRSPAIRSHPVDPG